MTATSTVPLPMESAVTSPRAVLYLAYARLLDFPGPALNEAVRTGEVGRELRALHEAADSPAPGPIDEDTADLEQQYIATFEVGAPESPAPLYETAYDYPDGEDRRSVLEELVRFYEYFDLDLGDRPVEQPDHITVELELMAVLAQMESLSTEQAASPSSFRLAQRDFLARHLVPFVEAIRRRPIPPGIYTNLLAGLSAVLETERQRLEAYSRSDESSFESGSRVENNGQSAAGAS